MVENQLLVKKYIFGHINPGLENQLLRKPIYCQKNISSVTSFFIILLEGHQTYSVYLATIWSQDYLDL